MVPVCINTQGYYLDEPWNGAYLTSTALLVRVAVAAGPEKGYGPRGFRVAAYGRVRGSPGAASRRSPSTGRPPLASPAIPSDRQCSSTPSTAAARVGEPQPLAQTFRAAKKVCRVCGAINARTASLVSGQLLALGFY
ncbi:hypothetical protein PVAP13_7NG347301 [Panicum virgatum]|uniref:Uncharacterized protein n=1 Tax=Panicum virgatum TaxID=38727 RepID=A0A8T0QEW9_PANVG|nr:hypothetical protein PVAP13_7NG347301 [Panicum virgatum]